MVQIKFKLTMAAATVQEVLAKWIYLSSNKLSETHQSQTVYRMTSIMYSMMICMLLTESALLEKLFFRSSSCMYAFIQY